MWPAQDFQLQIVFPHSPQDLGDALAIDRPSGQVPEVNQIWESFDQNLEGVHRQLRGLVDVEALESRVVHLGDANAQVGVGQI